MTLNKFGVVLLALLLAAMAMVPMVSAHTADTSLSPGADKYMEWAYTMEGKEVPVSQIIEKRSPGYWANLSEDKKTAFSKMKTEIPNYHQFAQTTERKSASATTGVSYQNDVNANSPKTIIYYTADAIGSAGAIPGGINYWATTRTNYPCPYSLVIADLMRWDGSKWVREDENTATGYFTTLTEAWKNKFFPQSGLYATYSQHFGDFPPGAQLPTWELFWWSNTVQYS